MSQGALRYPACFGGGARKNGFSKMMAWGVLWTKAQAKPYAGITPRSLNAWKQESQNPRIYGLDPSCPSGQGPSVKQRFHRQHLFYSTFLLAGAG